MMQSVPSRLIVAAGMFALLLLALAYWWLDNLPHELFGVALFAAIGWHVFTNRRWFANLAKGRYDVRRTLIVALHFALIAGMLVLLGTSIVISRSVFAFLPLPDSVPLRDVHWFSAYWVMMLVGVHLGLHWTRVMAMTSSVLGLSRASTTRTWASRLVLFLIVVFGIWSVPILDIWTKLTFNFSLNFWNFQRSVAPFFLHWTAVVALPAALAHYCILLTRRSRSPRSSSASSSSA